jgi:hypothetical protein
VQAHDPDTDALAYRWSVWEESRARSAGGDREALPRRLPIRFQPLGAEGVRFTAPVAPGAYRLYVTVHDGRGHAAYANFPFLVRRARPRR